MNLYLRMLRLLRMLARPIAIVALWLTATGFFGTAYLLGAGRRPRLDDEIVFTASFAVASAVSAAIALAVGGRRRWAVEAALPMAILVAMPVAVAGVLSWLAPAMGWTLMRISGFPRSRGHLPTAVWETAKLTFPSGAILGAAVGAVAGVLLLLARRWPRLVGSLVISLLLACVFSSFHIEAFGRVTDLLVKVRLIGVHRLVYSWNIGFELSSALGATAGAVVGAIGASGAVRMDGWKSNREGALMKNRMLIVVGLALTVLTRDVRAVELHVSPSGDDDNPGTAGAPLASFAEARARVRDQKESKAAQPITVTFHAGIYRLPETLVFTPEDSGTETAPITYRASPGEQVVVSGGVLLRLSWMPYKNGIIQAVMPPGFTTDQLFVNGQRQTLARYPNEDPHAKYFHGFAADAFSQERAKRWAYPKGGFIHAMHKHMWGDFHYVITGKDAKNDVTYAGGWQNNRRLGIHDQIRFVENIAEELDAPGEWFLNPRTRLLSFVLPVGVDPIRADVEGVRLRHLVEFRGEGTRPVAFVTLKGFVFRHAARTFMENREPLLRSDWTIYRGGAIVFEGTDHCSLEDSTLDRLGGNAIFVSRHNRKLLIRGCHITEAGANGVAFVGDPKAVRSPLFEYGERQALAQIDRTPGPQTDDYPADCLVEDCLIERTGRVEKQSAPIEIAMAQGITVRHCSIYDVPRAGINIGDGCWGGHLIEFCDVFDTVKETGDHGSFNSWGRDRYWGLKDVDLNALAKNGLRDLPRLDTVKPIILRNNRWRCDHGWDIDLDDGSSNYRIENNLCLNGGIKLREGFDRVVENNIVVANSFHPHVWHQGSDDIFRRNIVFTDYQPIKVPKPWGQECDFNLWHQPGKLAPSPALALQAQSGRDEHSLEADAKFLDPSHGDYRVADDSPALKLGFKNFPMDQFGVQSQKLKRSFSNHGTHGNHGNN
jgi:hypothetical protein